MSFYELTSLSAGIFNFFLTLFVLCRGWQTRLNQIYVLWGMALVLWNFCCFFKYQVSLAENQEALHWLARWLHMDTRQVVLWLLRLLHVAVVILPVSSFHMSLLIGGISKPRLLAILYGVHLVFAVSVFTPLYIRDQQWTLFGYYAVGGPAFWTFLVFYFVLSGCTLTMIYLKQRKLSRLYRTRLRALLLALTILFLAGTHDMLPLLGLKLGVLFYPMTRIPIQPLGNLAAMFYGIILAYTVLQYQLLDIHLNLSRFAAQLVRMLFMFITGFVLLTITSQLLPSDAFPPIAFVICLVTLFVTAALTSTLFPRFFGQGDEKWERRILGDSFEYHDRIRIFIQNISSINDSDQLFHSLHDLLSKTVRVARYHIFLKDELHHNFTLFRTYPQVAKECIELKVDSPIFQLFRSSRVKYLALRMTYSLPGESAEERAARQQIAPLKSEICFPFLSGDEPFGLLLLGEKITREPYTTQDILLLTDLVHNLSLVLNQIRLMNQLMIAEEMELLGKMSRGIAHDMNNLLTPVFTYLQLASAGVQGPEMTQELLPTAMRNMDAMRAYVRESLFFSKTKSLQLKMFHLDKVMRTAVELTRDRARKKNITTLVHAPSEVCVEMDEVLIQRLVGNLLSNAIDASPEGSQTHVHLLPMSRTESQRDWFRLLVVDHGEGISTDNLKRVTKGYFTTKDHGDTTRGFGLGLAICRKIVHMHGGQLAIHSQEGKGTTVQVDLPSRIIQPQPEAAPAFS